MEFVQAALEDTIEVEETLPSNKFVKLSFFHLDSSAHNPGDTLVVPNQLGTLNRDFQRAWDTRQ